MRSITVNNENAVIANKETVFIKGMYDINSDNYESTLNFCATATNDQIFGIYTDYGYSKENIEWEKLDGRPIVC